MRRCCPDDECERRGRLGCALARSGLVVFCKKNAKDLGRLIDWLEGQGAVVVVDEEADYASPNAKRNEGTKTRINELVSKLIGEDGSYVGVTATPARLDLNNTFGNDTESWVNFPPHAEYTGQEVFFPLNKKTTPPYRRVLLDQGVGPNEMRDAIVRFLVTSAYLNCYKNVSEENYTMLVHTSGRKHDHEADRALVQGIARALSASETQEFEDLVTRVHEAAQALYPEADADRLTIYVVENASRVVADLYRCASGLPPSRSPCCPPFRRHRERMGQPRWGDVGEGKSKPSTSGRVWQLAV